MPGDGLGVLSLPGVADGLGVQALYLPALSYSAAAPVPDDGDAVLDLTLVQHRPEREVPPLCLKERSVLDGEQPRRLIGLQVELQPVKSVLRHALPPRCGHPTYYDTPSRRFHEGRETGRDPHEDPGQVAAEPLYAPYCATSIPVPRRTTPLVFASVFAPGQFLISSRFASKMIL